MKEDVAKVKEKLKQHAKSSATIVLSITLATILYGIKYGIPPPNMPIYVGLFNAIALISFLTYQIIRDYFREKEHQRRLSEIERRIALFKEEKEKAIAVKQRIEAELRAKRIQLVNRALPERVRRFFEVLEKRGIVKLKDIEMNVLAKSKRAVIVLETKEALLDSTLLKAMSEFFENMGLEFKGGTLFRNFIHYELRNRSYITRCIRLDIPGTSSFLLIIKEQIGNFAEKIIEEYKEYVHNIIKKFISSEQYFSLSQESKRKLEKWYMEIFNPPIKPKIIVTTPYQTDIYTILRLVGEECGEECINMVRYEVKNILNQLIDAWNIKIAYLFEAADYNEGIVKSIENIEDQVRSRLKIRRFTEFLSLHDPYGSLLNSIEDIDKELVENIKKYEGNLEELRHIITDLKHIIF